jgi:hypothetical protein
LLAWLEANSIHESVVAQLRPGVLKKGKYAGSVLIHSGDDIRSVNNEGGVPVALQHGLLIVGSCPNGDPVVIDVRDEPGAAGYLCHETMWSTEDIRGEYVRLAPSLARLVGGIIKETMPLDYFEARQSGKGR